jgi:hypothetical protein
VLPAYFANILRRSHQKCDSLSGPAFLELAAKRNRFLRVLLCRQQNQIVGVGRPKAASIGHVAGGVNLDFTVPESHRAQLLLHRITVNKKNFALVIFREVHISATPRRASRHIANLAARGFKRFSYLLIFGELKYRRRHGSLEPD